MAGLDRHVPCCLERGFSLIVYSIEILTISLYVMTAYLKSDKLSIEAGMKYLILGALASGFFLYGISFLYGATHSTHFDVIQGYCQHPCHGPDDALCHGPYLRGGWF